MKVNYCDICNTPLKEHDFYTLYIAPPKDRNFKPTDVNDYYNYLNEVEKEVKDICPSCKKLMDEIFRLRLQNLNQINDELFGIYNLPTKKEKRNGKNNK
jgi:hypothetical protein